MLCRVGNQLMEHHCNCLTGLRAQRHFGTVNLSFLG